MGEESLSCLKEKRVCLFGLGGVGGYAAEVLARSGIGAIDLVDSDRVSTSNRNRQIIALKSTEGLQKTSVLASRLKDINPSITLREHNVFFLPENADSFDFSAFDYVIDAVDTVSAKLEIIIRCKKSKTPVISSMGTGNKLDPTRFRVADIYETSICPLARVMRRELKKRGVENLKVVFSDEAPRKPISINAYEDSAKTQETADFSPGKRAIPGSVPWVPPAAGLILGGEVVMELIQNSPYNF